MAEPLTGWWRRKGVVVREDRPKLAFRLEAVTGLRGVLRPIM